METKEVTRCRIDGGPLDTIVDLGNFHLNGFVSPGDPDPEKAPLQLAIGRTSRLVQLRHSVDPQKMYRKYWYRSGVNERMISHLATLAQAVKFHRPGLKTILDIGSNDWTFLNNFNPRNTWRIGFDPSDIEPVIFKPANSFVVNDYFSAFKYFKTFQRQADVVTSIAMFYDLDDPVAFAKEVDRVLAPGGLWVIEMHYLPAMLENVEFDAICHEHLTYYSLSSLERVLDEVDMVVDGIEFNKINGGSFRVYVRRAVDATGENDTLLALIRNKEDRINYGKFAGAVAKAKEQTGDFFQKHSRDLILGYGASTKGNTLLQHFGLTPKQLPMIADRDPRKDGLETAGTRIPIVSEYYARKVQPDYFYVLPYHFFPEFVRRESDYIEKGGALIHPLPTPIIWRGL